MSDPTQQMKVNAATAALQFIEEDQIVGIGTGNTVNIFIQQLATIKHKIAGTVASSLASQALLKSLAIPVLDFNSVADLPIYIDSTNEYNELKQLIKGGGGALTQEKILASASKKFICIVDSSKQPDMLGKTSVAIEVLPMARSYVARKLVSLGGQPQYRDNFVTDNGNIILDVFGWQITQPLELEQKINAIPGVIENGIFAARRADIILVGNTTGAKEL